MVTIEQRCAEALARLAALTDARIAAFRIAAAADAEHTRRSFAQKFRRLREALTRRSV